MSRKNRKKPKPKRLVRLPDGAVFEAIEPATIYRFQLPDGRVLEVTGADLLAAADAEKQAAGGGKGPRMVEVPVDRLDTPSTRRFP